MPLYSSNTLDTDKSVVVRFTNSAKLDFYIISWNIGLEWNFRLNVSYYQIKCALHDDEILRYTTIYNHSLTFWCYLEIYSAIERFSKN